MFPLRTFSFDDPDSFFHIFPTGDNCLKRRGVVVHAHVICKL